MQLVAFLEICPETPVKKKIVLPNEVNMDANIRKMYNYLLSHTFPGLILTLQIIFALQWFTSYDIFGLFNKLLIGEAGVIIVVLLIIYAISTLFGIIVDGIHHFLFEDVYELFKKLLSKKPKSQLSNEAIIDEDDKTFYDCFPYNISYEVYQDRIVDDYWYYSEAYANISIVMVPGFYLLYHWLCKILKVCLFSFCGLSPLVVYAMVLLVMIYEAFATHAEFDKEQNAFIASFSKRIVNSYTE